MADSKKRPMEISARGIAAFTWLYKPDTKYAKRGDKGKYKISLVVDKDELSGLKAKIGGEVVSGTEWLAHIQELHEERDGSKKNSPVKDGDKPMGKAKKVNGEFKGKFLINFKSGFRPGQVDSKGANLPDDVWVGPGDLVKVSYRPHQWDEGVSLRLNGVMLLDKRAGGGTGFGEDDYEDEGYTVNGDSDGDGEYSGDGDY